MFRDPKKHLSREEAERIEQLTGKYFNADMETAFRSAVRHGTGKAKTIRLKSLIDSGRLAVMPADEWEELIGLQRRLAEARTAELPAGKAEAYIAAKAAGIVADADERREVAERARREELWDSVVAVTRFQPSVARALDNLPGALLTDEEMSDAVERWDEHSAFERAKAEFDEAFGKADSVTEKAQLLSNFPEFQGD